MSFIFNMPFSASRRLGGELLVFPMLFPDQIPDAWSPLSGTCNLMLPAPGELEEDKIVVRTFLVNTAKIIPQIAESKKKTKPLALIAIAILIQDLFTIHSALL